MRQAGDPVQRSPSEVEAIELNLFGGMGQRERHDEGAERRRLTGLRASHDREMPLRPCQIDLECFAPLIVGPVDDPDGNAQACDAPDARQPGLADNTVEGR